MVQLWYGGNEIQKKLLVNEGVIEMSDGLSAIIKWHLLPIIIYTHSYPKHIFHSKKVVKSPKCPSM